MMIEMMIEKMPKERKTRVGTMPLASGSRDKMIIQQLIAAHTCRRIRKRREKNQLWIMRKRTEGKRERKGVIYRTDKRQIGT